MSIARRFKRAGCRIALAGIGAGSMASFASAGASYNASASTSKLFFDPDLSGGTQSKTITGNPPVASSSMPTPAAYQLNQTFTSGTASSKATGSLGYVLNSTTATFTLAAGTGVAQNDPSNLYLGASQLRIDFDGRFNPTSPAFGPVATGYVSIAIGGTVGAGGYAYFRGQVDFLNANTNAPLRPQVNFGGETFSVVGTFARTYTSSSILNPPTASVPVGTPIRVKGFFEFRASNADEPSDIAPVSVDVGSAPPTATWYYDVDGSWNDAANWTPPAGSFIDDPGNTIPTIPNGIGQRARLVSFAADNHIITLPSSITLGALDVDSTRSASLQPAAGAQLIMDTNGGPASVQVRNVKGGTTHDIGVPVVMNDALDVTADGSYFGPGYPRPRSTVNFNAALTDLGANQPLSKFGEGTATLNQPNTYAGGTVIAGGKLDANVSGSLGSGAVHADNGQLNYNAPHAAAVGASVLADNCGQIHLGVDPDATEHFTIGDGAISGTPARLALLSNQPGGNLTLSPGAMIAHEAFDSDPTLGNPAGITGPPQYVFGIAADFPTTGTLQVITVGAASPGPWRGFGGDRSDRIFGSDIAGTADRVQIAGQAELVALHETTIINGQVLTVAPNSSFIKRGKGTIILNNIGNQVDGPITVPADSGTLLIDGVLLNQPHLSVDVQSGSGFGGGGIVQGPVTIQSGATLSPGSNVFGFDVGTLTLDALSLADGAHVEMDLGQAFVAGLGVNDLVVVNGPLMLDGVLDVFDASGFGPGQYTLMAFSGSIIDNGLIIGNVPRLDELAYSLSVVPSSTGLGGTVMLNVAVIPEPSALLAGALGAGLLLRQRRAWHR